MFFVLDTIRPNDMKISRLASSTADGNARISATVSWEGLDRSDREIFFETDLQFGDDLAPNPNAFLLATAIPAMWFGERRVLVDGQVCPQLCHGLNIAMQQLRKWYGDRHHPVAIEATEGFAPSSPTSLARTACCMSGGVDSLATFRQNRLDFPIDHPGAVKDFLFINGFDVGGHEAWDANQRGYHRARRLLSQFAHDFQAELIPIHTNIRFLEEDAPGGNYYTRLFVLQSFGACLAATAHALSARISTLLVPSSHDVHDLEPLGSHPLLDPNYSSSSLTVRHDGLERSRAEKVKLLGEWKEGLRVLRVCADPVRSADTINCGRCEKCVRTKVALLVLGKLDQCSTFEANDVTYADIENLWWQSPTLGASQFGYMSYGAHHFWEQLDGPLRAIGRHDLADAVAEKLADGHRLMRRERWKERLKRMDERLLGSTLSKMYLRVRR